MDNYWGMRIEKCGFLDRNLFKVFGSSVYNISCTLCDCLPSLLIRPFIKACFVCYTSRPQSEERAVTTGYILLKHLQNTAPGKAYSLDCLSSVENTKFAAFAQTSANVADNLSGTNYGLFPFSGLILQSNSLIRFSGQCQRKEYEWLLL